MSIKDKLLRNLKECRRKKREQGWLGMYRYAGQMLHNVRLKAGIHSIGARYSSMLPRKVQIESSSKCNLSCPACSHAREIGKGQHLTPADLQTILRRLELKPFSIILSGIGEPLLNPQFFEMVEILSAEDINCAFFTNGTMFTPRINAAILSCPSICSIAISLDGARKKTFETMRAGADFERWKLLVHRFVEAAGQRRPLPILTLTHTVLTKLNFDEVEEIVLLGAQMGFGRMHFLDLVPVDEIAGALALSDQQCSFARDRILETAKMLKMHVTFDLRRREVPPKAGLRCLQPWDYIMIRTNGDVHPCAAVFGSDKALMGNIFQQDFTCIWHGDQFGNFRKTLLEGTNPLCNTCPYY